MKYRFFIDQYGSPRADLPDDMRIVNDFLTADVQTWKSAKIIIDGIDALESIPSQQWESTVNAYTLIASIDIATISYAYNDGTNCDQQIEMPLNVFREIMRQWSRFLEKGRPFL